MSLITGVTIYDFVGSPREANEILIVPCLLDFDFGIGGSVGNLLGDYHDARSSLIDDLERNVATGEHFDLVCWVRARLSAVFKIAPPIAEFSRGHLIDNPFIAIVRSEDSASLDAIPFVCSDVTSEPGLIFRSEESEDHKQNIAIAFWQLVFSKPLDLVPFQEFLFDDYDGFEWYLVGCDQHGLVACDAGTLDGRETVHSHFARSRLAPCLDCDGTGQQPLDFVDTSCTTCEGVGALTWSEAVTRGMVGRGI